MALGTSRVTVTTSATKVCDGSEGGSDPVWVEIYNAHASATVYIGGSDVTAGSSGNGRPVPAGQSWAFPLGPNDDVYAIVSASTAPVIAIKGRQ